MAKDTKVTFENDNPVPNKPSSGRANKHNRATERQISYEETENCVNEMSENFPALSNRAHRLMRQVSESFNYRTIKVALILSVILNLLLGIPFGIFFGFWMSQKHEATLIYQNAPSSSSSGEAERLAWNEQRQLMVVQTCLKCKDLLKHFGLNFVKTHVKVRSKNDICCTDLDPYFPLSAEVIQHLATGASGLDSNTGGPCPDAHAVAPRVAAHLMLDVKETKMKTDNMQGRGASNPLTWMSTDHNGGRTFVTGGLQYSQGFLVISQSGRYHVYSHLTLSAIENSLGENVAEKLIVHSISRAPQGKPRVTLLFAQETLKVDEVKSTHIEGSFELEQGDVISVYVSHPSFLKDKPPANIFGLFKL